MGASDPSPRPDHTAQGSSTGVIYPYNFWLQKPVGGWGSRKNCWVFRKLQLKDPHSLRMYTNPTTLGFNTRTTAGRAPLTYGEWVK